MGNGHKADEGKLRWTLVPWVALEQVVRVLEVGAAEYGDDNWQLVEPFEQRYTNSLLRQRYQSIWSAQADRHAMQVASSHIINATARWSVLLRRHVTAAVSSCVTGRGN